MKKIMVRVLVAILIVLSIIGIAGFAAYKKINKTEVVDLNMNEEELNVSQETAQKSKEKKITNILLLGVDKDENASDAIMVLSIDENNKNAKLTSLMRDMYVNFGEGKANKINYAYHYGGVPLSISTINEIFNLDITKYAKVDFNGFMNIVDSLGGYEVDITEAERKEINYKLGYEGVKTAGKVKLTGEQTAAYARIRRIDSDYQRTERQREIMFDILNKIKARPVSEYPDLIAKLSSNVETNLSTMEALELGNYLVGVGNNDIEQFRLPIDGTATDFTSGVYHLNWDKEKNLTALHEFIYGE
ncbi:MAG: LCP family protein [Clostridium sp.]|uniref:LCP family protein n=1 Tax=Clostridium sp. DSM 8431 TaxID=1761781 RepID=UPI0008F293B2|nr:LCP family protein [Clostridium sp. DSM 8431]MCR4944570.1 LCP family protein [Clostridium sp.]SFU37914.1 transcriptional attenuator, LytR family [Clostridium sp. DSM 8431]